VKHKTHTRSLKYLF